VIVASQKIYDRVREAAHRDPCRCGEVPYNEMYSRVRDSGAE